MSCSSPSDISSLSSRHLVSVLFKFLWARDRTGSSPPSVFIPDTIVYRARALEAWYFSAAPSQGLGGGAPSAEGDIDTSLSHAPQAAPASPAGVYRRSARSACSAASIHAAFLAATPPGLDVVAVYVCAAETPDDRLAEDTPPTVEYLDRAGLLEVLTVRKKGMSAILQRFVAPRGSHNAVVQAQWTPRVCALERRVPRSPLYETRAPVLARAATWDALPEDVDEGAVHGATVPALVEAACEAIADHVAEVSSHAARVTAIKAFFKQGSDGRIYLLWVSGLHVDEVKMGARVDLLKARINSAHAQAQVAESARLLDGSAAHALGFEGNGAMRGAGALAGLEEGGGAAAMEASSAARAGASVRCLNADIDLPEVPADGVKIVTGRNFVEPPTRKGARLNFVKGYAFDAASQCPSCGGRLCEEQTARVMSVSGSPFSTTFGVVEVHWKALLRVLGRTPYVNSVAAAAWDGAVLDEEASDVMRMQPEHYFPSTDVVLSLSSGVGIFASGIAQPLFQEREYKPSRPTRYPLKSRSLFVMGADGQSNLRSAVLKTRSEFNAEAREASELHEREWKERVEYERREHEERYRTMLTNLKVPVPEIPPAIGVTLPALTPTQYRMIKNDAFFTSRPLSVCERCFVIFTAVSNAVVAGHDVRFAIASALSSHEAGVLSKRALSVARAEYEEVLNEAAIDSSSAARKAKNADVMSQRRGDDQIIAAQSNVAGAAAMSGGSASSNTGSRRRPAFSPFLAAGTSTDVPLSLLRRLVHGHHEGVFSDELRNLAGAPLIKNASTAMSPTEAKGWLSRTLSPSESVPVEISNAPEIGPMLKTALTPVGRNPLLISSFFPKVESPSSPQPLYLLSPSHVPQSPALSPSEEESPTSRPPSTGTGDYETPLKIRSITELTALLADRPPSSSSPTRPGTASSATRPVSSASASLLGLLADRPSSTLTSTRKTGKPRLGARGREGSPRTPRDPTSSPTVDTSPSVIGTTSPSPRERLTARLPPSPLGDIIARTASFPGGDVEIRKREAAAAAKPVRRTIVIPAAPAFWDDVVGAFSTEGFSAPAMDSGVLSAGRVRLGPRKYVALMRRVTEAELTGMVWEDKETDFGLAALSPADLTPYAISIASLRSGRVVTQFVRRFELRESINPLVRTALEREASFENVDPTAGDSRALVPAEKLLTFSHGHLVAAMGMFSAAPRRPPRPPSTAPKRGEPRTVAPLPPSSFGHSPRAFVAVYLLAAMPEIAIAEGAPMTRARVPTLHPLSSVRFPRHPIPPAPVGSARAQRARFCAYVSSIFGTARQPVFLLRRFDPSTGHAKGETWDGTRGHEGEGDSSGSDSESWLPFARLAWPHRRVPPAVLYAAKCRFVALAGHGAPGDAGGFRLAPVRPASDPLPGAVVRLIPGHWLGGQASLDRARGFVGDSKSMAESSIVSDQMRMQEAVGVKMIETWDEAARKTAALAVSMGRAPTAQGGRPVISTLLPPTRAAQTPDEMRPVDIKRTLELLYVTHASAREKAYWDGLGAEVLQEGSIGRRLLRRPDGSVLHCSMSLGFPDEAGKDQSLKEGKGAAHTAALLANIVGSNARAMYKIRIFCSSTGVVTTRWISPDEARQPLTDFYAFDRGLDNDAPFPGNPFIDADALVACVDTPVAAGETVVAARIINGDDVQRFVGIEAFASPTVAAATGLGPHESVALGGAYLLSLWALHPPPKVGYAAAPPPTEADGDEKDGVDAWEWSSADEGCPIAVSVRATLTTAQASAAVGIDSGQFIRAAHARSGMPTLRLRAQYLRQPMPLWESAGEHDSRAAARPGVRKSARLVTAEMMHWVASGNALSSARLPCAAPSEKIFASTFPRVRLQAPGAVPPWGDPVYTYQTSLTDLARTGINPFIELLPRKET